MNTDNFTGSQITLGAVLFNFAVWGLVFAGGYGFGAIVKWIFV